jgi:uncharacterized membrane protein
MGTGMYWFDMGRDLQLTIIFALLTVDAIYLPVINATFIRLALGLGMVLFVPGYSLVAVLFPGRKEIDGLERVALSFGLSIAVAPLIGIVLNFTLWGLQLDPIVVCLTTFTIICALAAQVRRYALKPEDRFAVDFGKMYKDLKEKAFPAGDSRLGRALTVILALSVIASIAMLAYVVTMPRQGEKFTEFYILGPDGRAEGLPAGMFLGEQRQVTVGVVNHEYVDVPYDLVIQLNDSGNISVLHTEQLTLSDDQKWERMVNVTPDRAGQGMNLEFLLYTDGELTRPYRDLRLCVNVTDRKP